MTEKTTERELADSFQSHKEDEDDWEEAPAPAPRRKRRPLSVNMSIRFTASEAVAIQEEANRLGLSSSELVRRAVQHLVRPVSLGSKSHIA